MVREAGPGSGGLAVASFYERHIVPWLAWRFLSSTAARRPCRSSAAAFDSVVCTDTLCSVDSPAEALREARRVLKPVGRL
jgi:ubiquinone/menaquinone biosynthesis C-methylase UbiE